MKFYVVVREKPGLSGADKNHRYERYSEAVDVASKLACKEGEPFIILEAFERVSPVVQVSRELLHPEEASRV